MLCPFGFLCSILIASVGFDETTDSKILIEQAVKDWTEYKKNVRDLQCKVENKLTTNGILKFHCTSEYKQNSSCRLCIRSYRLGGPKKPTDKAEGFNRNYAFSLSKLATSTAWRIEEIVNKWQETVQDLEDPHSTMQDIDILMRVNFLELTSLVKRDDFKVEKIARHQSNENEVVEVTFTCIHDPKAEPFFPIQRGKITFIPKLYWCVSEATLYCKYTESQSDITIKNEFTVTGKLPLPSMHSMKQSNQLPGGVVDKVSRTLTYSDVQQTSPPDDEFRLSAFGLPEPVNVKYDKPYPWYFWGIIGGGVLLFIGLVIRRYAVSKST